MSEKQNISKVTEVEETIHLSEIDTIRFINEFDDLLELLEDYNVDDNFVNMLLRGVNCLL